MSYIAGISDNITQYSSTTALSAVDASTLANGTLASVDGGPMFYFVKNSNRTANGTTILRAFNSAGRWIEYFLQTGQTYVMIDDNDNTLITSSEIPDPLTVNTINATTGNITTVNSTTGNIATLAATTVGATTGNIVTVNSTTGNIATLAATTVGATTGNIVTVNSTTGNIATLAATTVGATTGNITTVNSTTTNSTGVVATTLNVSGQITNSTGPAIINKQFAANSGSSITIDPANGAYQKIVLTANTTITLASTVSALTEKEFILELVQDATGGRSVAWSNITFAINSGTAPAINQTALQSTYIGIAGTNSAWIGFPVNQGIGVTDASTASTGYVGEVLQNIVASSGVSLTTATVAVVTSVAYTAGDWLVTANPTYIGTGITATELQSFLGTALGVSTTGQTTDNTSYGTPFVVGVTARSTTPISYVFNTSTSGTLYLKAKATFSAGTCTAFGALTMVRYR